MPAKKSGQSARTKTKANAAKASRAETPQDIKKGSLHFFSCGIDLPEEAVRACEKADLVAASPRLLDALGKDRCREVLVLDAKARERVIEAQKAAGDGRTVVVLASGDALFHGIGSTFVHKLGFRHHVFALCPETLEIDQNAPTDEDMDEEDRLGSFKEDLEDELGTSVELDPGADLALMLPPPLPFELVFHPGPTAAQALCHRLGIPFEDVPVFSCHSMREKDLPVIEITRAYRAIIYAGSPCTPEVIAQRLLDFEKYQAGRKVLVASELGTEREKMVLTNLAGAARGEFPPTSMLYLLSEGAVVGALPLAAPDSAFRFDQHIITHRWVRPAILGALTLMPDSTLWDLGAGSGSVSIEAAQLCPRLCVHAVEKRSSRCENIRATALERGLTDYHVHEGEILPLLRELASENPPTSVFIGGGGEDVPQILDWLLDEYQGQNVRIVAVAVTLDSLALLAQYPRDQLDESFSLTVEENRPLKGTDSLIPEPQHRIHVFCYYS